MTNSTKTKIKIALNYTIGIAALAFALYLILK
nr:MAG TPA: hypothetical protein [Caudoviricetes sp.]